MGQRTHYKLFLIACIALLVSILTYTNPFGTSVKPESIHADMNTETKQIYTEHQLTMALEKNKTQKVELDTMITSDEAFKYAYESFARYPELYMSYSPKISLLKYDKSSQYCKGYYFRYISRESGKIRTEEVDEVVNRIVYYAGKRGTDEEKVDYVLNWFRMNCKYTDTPNNMWDMSLYGCLVDRKSTCVGFAESFQLIMNRLEIPCEIVVDTKKKRHVWNQVYINGEKKKINVTACVH